MIKMLIFGSPCTYWSGARKQDRETEPSGLGWELFLNGVIAKEKFNPDLFLMENNASINPDIKSAISKKLGVENMTIDASLVSAQHRNREYWFNWNCAEPNDMHIDPKSILDNPEDFLVNACADGSIRTIKAGYYKQGLANFITNGGHGATAVAHKVDGNGYISQYDESGRRRRNADNIYYEVKDGKIEINYSFYSLDIPDGKYIIRKLSPEETERCQTLPVGYTDVGISDTSRYKGIGNGWCVNVLRHIFEAGLSGVDKDEEIVVLSLYDGIGTGRLILDQLGFMNVKYYAYEIDETAKKIATSNYPDIIEMGDAFSVRNNDWKI